MFAYDRCFDGVDGYYRNLERLRHFAREELPVRRGGAEHCDVPEPVHRCETDQLRASLDARADHAERHWPRNRHPASDDARARTGAEIRDYFPVEQSHELAVFQP